MIPSTIKRTGARAGRAASSDVLTEKFLEIHAPERQADPHPEAQRVCSNYAAQLRLEKKPRPHLWARGFAVIGLAVAVLWSWPYIVGTIW